MRRVVLARRGGRGRGLLAALAVGLCAQAACSFDTSGGGAGGPGTIDGAPVDDSDATAGLPDAGPVTCEPDDTLCVGQVIETCNSQGDGYVTESREVCGLSCEEGGSGPFCTLPSNIPPTEAQTCELGAAKLLAPAAGTVVTIDLVGDVERITCNPHCGVPGQTTIDRKSVVEQGTVDLAWFCLSDVNIPAGVTITVSPLVSRSLAFLVDGDAAIAGDLNLDGLDAIAGPGDPASVRGLGGPGAGDGAAPAASGSNGTSGGGACGGGPGARVVDNDGGDVGSGAGGGGHAAAGGSGGRGQSEGTGGSDNGIEVNGGPGGAATCGAGGTLIPLLGGSGGGSGGDGEGGLSGWPGGGGGGAVQISARGTLTITGAINTRGGSSDGLTTDTLRRGGGGGGGAGGAVLLEAHELSLTGQLRVAGGNGGLAGAGPGGPGGGSAGAPNAINGGAGSNEDEDDEGGAGGGGAAGRVRLNALLQPACGAFVLPAGGCTSGVVAR